MPSRTQVARYLAKKLPNASGAERAELIAKTANWLKANGQTKDIDRLVQDVAGSLADNGYIFATVTSARELSAGEKSEISSYIKTRLSADSTEVVYTVEPSLIGGIKIQTAKGTLDDSVQGKLTTMVENIG